MGYGDYDDPDMYSNAAYGGGRYATNGNYGARNNGYGYGQSYGSQSRDRENSAVKRSAWNGGQSYGSYGSSSYSSGSAYGAKTYGAGDYGAHTTERKAGGLTYGGATKMATQKPTGTGKDLSAFAIGKKVTHPKFGAGTIVGMRGVGANMIVDIAFEGLGIKQLSASLAPLTIL